MLSKTNIVQYSFYSCFALLSITGLLTYSWYNIPLTLPILEVLFFGTALLLVSVPKKRVILFFLISIGYVFFSYVLMTLYNPSNPLDFLQAFKAFIYVAPLCFFFKKNVFELEKTVFFLKLLMLAFLAKYLYSIILHVNPRMGERPGIFAENNFELIFLITLYFVFSEHFGKSKNGWFALLSLIVIISGSRSALLALLVSFCGLYLNKLSVKTFIYVTFFLLLSFLAGYIFLSRMSGGIETIDRFNFMMSWLYETSDWPAWKYLIGSYPITPLSNETCKWLSYYERLYSYQGDGTCYSVILHSYLLRVIFDHGAVGLVFLILFIYLILTGSGISRFKSLCVLGIFLTSALSVSAMNSIFTTLALAIAISTYSNQRFQSMRASPSDASPIA